MTVPELLGALFNVSLVLMIVATMVSAGFTTTFAAIGPVLSQEEVDRRRPLLELVAHRSDDGVEHRGTADEQPLPVCLPELADDRTHCGDERPPEYDRIVVGRF